jgi:hypothetical protein
VGHAAALAPALVAGAALYAPVLRLFFAQDDVTFLSRAAGLEPTPWSFARPLSEGLIWRSLHAAFGLHPAPYHVVRLALHLAAAALVYAIGLRLLRGRFAAGAAAFLFAVSSIGFTGLHWASCIVEISAAVLALAAFALHLDALERRSGPRLWLAAGVAAAAVLAKESTIGLPVMFALATVRARPRGERLRALRPIGALFAALAAAFFATRSILPYGQYTGGNAYALAFGPLALAAQWLTYLRWSVLIGVPVREAAPASAAALVLTGLAIMAAVGVLLWAQRRDTRHPAEVGAAWFTVFLLPVMPLVHHAYLYYLYLPWAGACWLLAGAGERIFAPWPRPLAAAAAASALVLVAALEWRSVRTRESARFGPLPADKTVREALLLGNAVASLHAAEIEPGTRIGFLNPFPQEHGNVAGRARRPGEQVHSYIPLEGAMRGGESLRLFFPGTRYMGFADVPPPEWDDTQIFLFENDGTLTPVGSGARAYFGLAGLYERLGRTGTADTLRERARALGGVEPH